MEEILEQPSLEPELNDHGLDSATQEGSIYGKFKDAKTLLDAYNSLQAEFTRKSQKLAEFQKENENIAVFNKEDSLDEVLKDETTDKEKYKKEITEILSENELDNLPNKYHVAFKIAKTVEQKIADNLNNIQFIDEYLTKNTSLKEKIIGEYLSSLNNISTPPKMISGNPSTIHYSNTITQPKTLREAGEIFSKMLK